MESLTKQILNSEVVRVGRRNAVNNQFSTMP
jgi:hypothetical protein